MPGTVVSPAGVALITQPLRGRVVGTVERWRYGFQVCVKNSDWDLRSLAPEQQTQTGVPYTHKLLAEPCTLLGGNWNTNSPEGSCFLNL